MQKNLKLNLLLFLFLSPSFLGFAQNDSLVFTGIIFDQENLNPLSEAVYLKKQTTYSILENGKFRLSLQKGDTVIFSHLGYKDVCMVASDSLLINDYLAGVYLTKKTYLLSEIMVFPRHYSLKTMVASSPGQTSQDQKNAERNLRISTYQGMRPPEKMDNEMNQKLALHKHRMNVEYKTMIAPDRMIGINTITIVPETKNYLNDLRKRDIHLDMGTSTTNEEQNYLKSVFVAFKKEQANKSK